MRREIQRLVKEELARHTSMRTIDGIEKVMEILYILPQVEKVKCRGCFLGSSSTKKLYLKRDPEIKNGLIAKFGSTNGTAVFGVVVSQEADLPTLIQDIEFAFQNHPEVQEIVLSKNLQQMLEKRKEGKMGEKNKEYKNYEWFSKTWQELRQKEGLGEWDAARWKILSC